MKRFAFRLATLAYLVLSLSACFGPKSPQEVTKAFWEAVLNDNVKYAVEYSTLSESKYYDSFLKDWSGFEPSFEKVTIEKKEASIVTEFSSPANSGLPSRSFTTYLVFHNGAWKVDYDRTKSSIHGGPLGDLVGTLGKMGDDLSRQLQSSADQFRAEMERMARELQQESRSYRQQAQKSIEQYAEQLRKSIKELQDSINRALKEEDKNLSDKDKHTLREISNDLNKENENLSRPNYETVARGSQEFSENQQQLEMLDNDSLVEFKKEWRELDKQFEDAMRKMMNELSSQNGSGDTAE